MNEKLAGLASLFEATSSEIEAYVDSGDILISSTKIPQPRGFPIAYRLKQGVFAYISTTAREQLSERMRATLFAELQNGNQAKAQSLFYKLHPASHVKSQLSLASTRPLAAAAAHIEIAEPSIEVVIPPTSAFTSRYAYTTEPAIFATVARGSYISGWDYILQDGAVLADSGYQRIEMTNARWPHQYFRDVAKVAHFDSPVVERDEEAIFLSAPVLGHIGHWMIDFLPRILGRNFRKLPFVVPANLTSKHYEMLSAFGVSSEDLVSIPLGQHARFRALHVYRPGLAMPPHPKHVDFVRKSLFKGTEPRPGKRIFLTRNDVNTRVAVNQAEVAEYLHAQGFIFVELAELSIAQQQEILGDAEILLGAFGTNMLALYHAPQGAKIIVLEAPDLDDPALAPTSHMLGMEHRRLKVTSVERSQSIISHKKNLNFVVDIGDLSRVIFS